SINAISTAAFTKLDELIRSSLIRDLKKPAATESFEVSTDYLVSFAGYYEPITPRLEMLRFLERLLGVLHVSSGDEKLQTRQLFGKSDEWIPVAKGHFRRKDDPVATVAFLRDHSGETLLQSYAGSTRGNYRAIAAWLVWTEWLLTVFSASLMLSSI